MQSYTVQLSFLQYAVMFIYIVPHSASLLFTVEYDSIVGYITFVYLSSADELTVCFYFQAITNNAAVKFV